MSPTPDQMRQQNADHWGRVRRDHVADWYDLEAFRGGACALRSLEIDALGDVAGKRLLHLQCNVGIDTLSWARRGAVVTGVDLSSENIAMARDLAAELGLDATFVCADVMDLDRHITDHFDLVFASYGVFCWIDDVPRWMRIAADRLEVDGLFYYVGGHPACFPFDADGTVEASYFHDPAPLINESGEDDPINYQWQWNVSDLVNAAIRAGLRVEEVGEYPIAAYEFMDGLVQDPEGWWRLPGIPHMPLSFSLRARKD